MSIDVCYLSHSSSSNAGGIYEIEKALATRMVRRHNVKLKVGAFYDGGHCDGWEVDCNLSLFGRETSRLKAMIDMRQFLNAQHFDIIHLHNLWTYPSLLTLEKSIRRRSNVVVTINGMLDSWALKQSKVKKKIASFLFEKINLNSAKLIHVNSVKEADDCRKFGIRAPIAIVPNGIDVTLDFDLSRASQSTNTMNKSKRSVLFLGRIHEKKGLVPLIEAWSRLPPELRHEWTLDIVGWDDGGFQSHLQDLVVQRGVTDSIVFHGALFGDDKTGAYANADAFILPSFSEGLPMAVLEAWAAGLATMVSPYCNLPIGYEENISLSVEPETSSILMQLDRVMSMSDTDRQLMGHGARKLVKDKFSWDTVTDELLSCYLWTLGENALPGSIHLD